MTQVSLFFSPGKHYLLSGGESELSRNEVISYFIFIISPIQASTSLNSVVQPLLSTASLSNRVLCSLNRNKKLFDLGSSHESSLNLLWYFSTQKGTRLVSDNRSILLDNLLGKIYNSSILKGTLRVRLGLKYSSSSATAINNCNTACYTQWQHRGRND